MYAYNFHQRISAKPNYKNVHYGKDSVVESKRVQILMDQPTVGPLTADTFTMFALYAFSNKVTRI